MNSVNEFILKAMPTEAGLYLLQFSSQHKDSDYVSAGVKVGCSSNIKERVRIYLNPWCRSIINYYFYKTEHYIEAEIILLERCRKRWPSVGSTEYFETGHFKPFISYVASAVKEAERRFKCSSKYVEKEPDTILTVS